MSLILALALATPAADAAEVVWLDAEPSVEDVAHVAAVAGATRAPYDADFLRHAADDFGERDVAAWAALDAALREVRAFETRLDGELVILRDLARPIAGITLLRDGADRDRLFAALAYQGFAADRFFGDGLAADVRAEGHRVAVPDGGAVPLAWADAMALDPERVPTPYEIAEAPQRARYAEDRARVATLLPGLLVVDGGLPRGAKLVVDGRPVTLDASGQLRLPPGRHLAHVERDGHVLARQDVRLEAAGTAVVRIPIGDAAWAGWLADLRDDGVVGVPEPLRPTVAALGGEVVVAWRDERGLHASKLTAEATTPLVLPRAGRVVEPEREGDAGGLQVQVAGGVGGGWFQSDDFYLQDPARVPHTVAAVNAGALDVALDVSVQKGLFRVSVIGDLAVPFGEHHVALTGDGSMRVRPDVSLGLGVKWVQVTGGFLFPYHPSVGLRLTVPVFRGLEVLASGKAGLPIALGRDDGSTWDGEPVVALWAGLGWRFGVPVGR